MDQSAAPKHNGLTLKQELFCQNYVKNDELRSNATMSYAHAYDFDLDDEVKYPRDDAVWDDAEEEPEEELSEEAKHQRNFKRRYMGRLLQKSTYDRAIYVCAVSASRLLRKDKVQRRIVELRNELLTDDVVDSMLAYWITSKENPAASVAAMKEYNKLRRRAPDIVEFYTPLPTEDKRKSALQKILRKNGKA